MLAAVLTAHNDPLKLAEVEPCELRAGQVLCRILVSGICGKQLGEIRGDYDEKAPIPRLLGHEACVIVEANGPGVTKLKSGDKAVAHWRKGSGMDCEFPRYVIAGYEGRDITSGRITTFSEMAIISENRLTKVPHETPNELCALLGCAMSTALAVMENDAQLKMGESVLIVGCGGVGLNLIRSAKLCGATRIVGRDQDNPQFAAAKLCGADGVECRHGGLSEEMFDVIVDTTGNAEAIAENIPRLKSGGRFIMVGQPKPEASIVMHAARHMFDGEGKTIKASQGGGFDPDKDIPRYVNMWRSGFLKIDGIVTDRYPLSRINDALDLVRSGSAGRVLLEMV